MCVIQNKKIKSLKMKCIIACGWPIVWEAFFIWFLIEACHRLVFVDLSFSTLKVDIAVWDCGKCLLTASGWVMNWFMKDAPLPAHVWVMNWFVKDALSGSLQYPLSERIMEPQTENNITMKMKEQSCANIINEASDAFSNTLATRRNYTCIN